ncbi:MAG: hypothetical protein A3F24_00275 [Candidatus Colwellbacteria bacterium RIFCSPHIGHO2_12_FULL_44_17]|uniref:Uncharacterized protein n=2 Tax=Candidatus Colwelliibacteriota TaxID=1817904 RepID=A0A1G1Z663_9BACT|nr:MAG: hypothetical protein A3F24_00275 [Candidatus Colwellbacteria bacterium RIFCSPHIGHO2_12_FULL_44_17]OGY60121.1 MAG: hypothetical protein A3I31_00185 [Candidatus Colwellbacteria bacterium RIFCSPLOWO2_02_FULL_44_20b]
MLREKKLEWTRHVRAKMRFYGLSEQRVRRVLHTPKRIEEGVAERTVAMMQSAGSPKHPYEIWTMVRDMSTTRRVISAWRYPGVTKPGEPLPEEILRELRNSSHD